MNIKAEIHVVQKMAQRCPKNVVSLIITSPRIATEIFCVIFCCCCCCSKTLLLSLVKFPPVGKPLLWMWWGAVKTFWVEEASAGSQIQGMVKLVPTGQHSGLARAACAVPAVQNLHCYSLERGLAGGHEHPHSTCPCLRCPRAVLGVFLQTCLP